MVAGTVVVGGGGGLRRGVGCRGEGATPRGKPGGARGTMRGWVGHATTTPRGKPERWPVAATHAARGEPRLVARSLQAEETRKGGDDGIERN